MTRKMKLPFTYLSLLYRKPVSFDPNENKVVIASSFLTFLYLFNDLFFSSHH